MYEYVSQNSVLDLDIFSPLDNGHVILVNILLEQEKMLSWLLMAGKDSVVLLALLKFGSVITRLSPKGKWVGVSDRDKMGGGAMPIKLVATDSGMEQGIKQEMNAVWVKP
jgi:hypothetical protein